MLNEKLYIEDLILHLAGVVPIDDDIDPPKLEISDINLIHSFGKQIVRNLGFTDRQYDLAKRKIDDYAEYFSFITEDIEEVKNSTRIPLRQIDRSRWIKIVENSKGDYEIAVRFTFQKKLISSLEDIRRAINDKGSYDKETKVHSFEYSEMNLFTIVQAFEGKNFDLGDNVKDIFNKLNELDPGDYIPGVYDFKIKNLHPNGEKLLVEELGEPTTENMLLYKDRTLRYGLGYVDNDANVDTTSLSAKIAHRIRTNISVNSTKVNFDELLLSLENLQRLPLLILVSLDRCYDTIVEMQQYVKNLIPNEQVSVMFRLDNQGEGVHFNDYIREQKINNKLDTNTKIVYCLDTKLPKPVLNSQWKPNTIILNDSKPVGTRKVVDCYSSNDLIIHYYDSQVPTHYFYRTDIEEIV